MKADLTMKADLDLTMNHTVITNLAMNLNLANPCEMNSQLVNKINLK